MKQTLSKVKPIIDKITALYKKISDIATPTVVLAIICVVVTLALSSTNALTHKKIETLAIQTKNDAMAKLIEADEYHELTAKTSFGDVTYNAAIKGGNTIGVIFTESAKGYGADIQVMTAVDMDCTVISIQILDVSGETPGLGQNVTKENFFNQFIGLKDGIKVIKGGMADNQNNEINAVTGATISSNAVTEAVNKALGYAGEILSKEKVEVVEELEYEFVTNLPEEDDLK